MSLAPSAPIRIHRLWSAALPFREDSPLVLEADGSSLQVLRAPFGHPLERVPDWIEALLQGPPNLEVPPYGIEYQRGDQVFRLPQSSGELSPPRFARAKDYAGLRESFWHWAQGRSLAPKAKPERGPDPDLVDQLEAHQASLKRLVWIDEDLSQTQAHLQELEGSLHELESKSEEARRAEARVQDLEHALESFRSSLAELRDWPSRHQDEERTRQRLRQLEAESLPLRQSRSQLEELRDQLHRRRQQVHEQRLGLDSKEQELRFEKGREDQELDRIEQARQRFESLEHQIVDRLTLMRRALADLHEFEAKSSSLERELKDLEERIHLAARDPEEKGRMPQLRDGMKRLRARLAATSSQLESLEREKFQVQSGQCPFVSVTCPGIAGHPVATEIDRQLSRLNQTRFELDQEIEEYESWIRKSEEAESRHWQGQLAQSQHEVLSRVHRQFKAMLQSRLEELSGGGLSDLCREAIEVLDEGDQGDSRGAELGDLARKLGKLQPTVLEKAKPVIEAAEALLRKLRRWGGELEESQRLRQHQGQERELELERVRSQSEALLNEDRSLERELREATRTLEDQERDLLRLEHEIERVEESIFSADAPTPSQGLSEDLSEKSLSDLEEYYRLAPLAQGRPQLEEKAQALRSQIEERRRWIRDLEGRRQTLAESLPTEAEVENLEIQAAQARAKTRALPAWYPWRHGPEAKLPSWVPPPKEVDWHHTWMGLRRILPGTGSPRSSWAQLQFEGDPKDLPPSLRDLLVLAASLAWLESLDELEWVLLEVPPSLLAPEFEALWRPLLERSAESLEGAQVLAFVSSLPGVEGQERSPPQFLGIPSADRPSASIYRLPRSPGDMP